MIPGLEDTPPEVAYTLGFMTCLALKRRRIEMLLDRIHPKRPADSMDSDSEK